MLLLPLLMLGVLIPGGDNEHAFQVPTSYHVIQIASFVNSTWAQNQGSGWLDDLQIHGWDSESGTVIFLKPWSKGNFSNQEMTELEELFQVYFIGFTRVVEDYVSEFQLTYPFVVQGIGGCELHSGKATVSFLRGALGGLDFLSFKDGSCVPAAEGGNRAQRFCAFFSHEQRIFDIIEKLLVNTCPRFLLGVLDAGKKELQKQVKPEAWFSSGPSPSPGRLLLVCHVSGFYPKAVRVMWMKGVQEQPGTHQGDLLPYADGTWYLRVTLDVAAGETANLNCRVKHDSLGGQDIVLYWEHSTSTSVIVLAVILPILILLICLALWFWRRRDCSEGLEASEPFQAQPTLVGMNTGMRQVISEYPVRFHHVSFHICNKYPEDKKLKLSVQEAIS